MFLFTLNYLLDNHELEILDAVREANEHCDQNVLNSTLREQAQ